MKQSSEPLGPASIPTAETLRFLLGPLPPPPARVLDVGCGDGVLLRALVDEGYDAVGIDSNPEALAIPESEGLPVVTADFLTWHSEPCDAIFFGRSLHHIAPLANALDHVRDLLRPTGVMVAEEFGVETMDVATATWLYGLDSVLQAAGILGDDSHARPEVVDPLSRWRAEHDADPPLNPGGAMVEEVEARFGAVRIERGPYLYRDFCARLENSRAGMRVATRIFDDEAAGVRTGYLAGVGLRIVGRMQS
jgi:SAM-dependent methyltransferase